MPRIIKYSVATQYSSGANRGYYNPTFLWGRLQAYLDFWSEYWDLAFQRVNSGAAVSFVQANTHTNPQAWMWTSGRTCYVSPIVNYLKNDWLCGMPSNHEMCHWNNASHLGQGNVMGPNGSNTNYTQLDQQRYLPYPWKSAKRPWNEPGFMRQKFPNATLALAKHEDYHDRQESQCDEIRASFGSSFVESLATTYTCCNDSKPSWFSRLIPLSFRCV